MVAFWFQCYIPMLNTALAPFRIERESILHRVNPNNENLCDTAGKVVKISMNPIVGNDLIGYLFAQDVQSHDTGMQLPVGIAALAIDFNYG